MKNQVTSIEQSKRLIELGVPAQKASMVWEMDEDCARLKIWNTDEETRRMLHNKYPDYYRPAYTVADLMGMIGPINTLGNPIIEKAGGDEGWVFDFGVVAGEAVLGYAECQNIVELLVGRIEWVVSNGYGLNL